MNCLFLDIASHDGFIACTDEHAILSSVACDHRLHDGELLEHIIQLLYKADWGLKNLTHLACTVGPGGFTSLRMAVTCINVLADQLHIPAAGVHLSDLAQARITQKDFLWLHSTKKEELFVRGFGEYSSRWPEPTHVILEDFLQKVPRGFLWTGELLPQHADALSTYTLHTAIPEESVKILPSFLQGLSYETNLLLPWYGRKP